MAVVAFSTDRAEDAAGTVAHLGLGFPVGWGLDLDEAGATLGAYIERRRGILHATGFLLKPGATIGVAVYSSGPVGRLWPGDVTRLVDFWSRQAAGG